MKRNLYVLISLITLAGMILAACGAKPTEAPVARVLKFLLWLPKPLRLARPLAKRPIAFPDGGKSANRRLDSGTG